MRRGLILYGYEHRDGKARPMFREPEGRRKHDEPVRRSRRGAVAEDEGC